MLIVIFSCLIKLKAENCLFKYVFINISNSVLLTPFMKYWGNSAHSLPTKMCWSSCWQSSWIFLLVYYLLVINFYIQKMCYNTLCKNILLWLNYRYYFQLILDLKALKLHIQAILYHDFPILVLFIFSWLLFGYNVSMNIFQDDWNAVFPSCILEDNILFSSILNGNQIISHQNSQSCSISFWLVTLIFKSLCLFLFTFFNLLLINFFLYLNTLVGFFILRLL